MWPDHPAHISDLEPSSPSLVPANARLFWMSLVHACTHSAKNLAGMIDYQPPYHSTRALSTNLPPTQLIQQQHVPHHPNNLVLRPHRLGSRPTLHSSPPSAKSTRPIIRNKPVKFVTIHSFKLVRPVAVKPLRPVTVKPISVDPVKRTDLRHNQPILCWRSGELCTLPDGGVWGSSAGS